MSCLFGEFGAFCGKVFGKNRPTLKKRQTVSCLFCQCTQNFSSRNNFDLNSFFKLFIKNNMRSKMKKSSITADEIMRAPEIGLSVN